MAPGRPATRLQAAGLHTAVAQPPSPGILPRYLRWTRNVAQMHALTAGVGGYGGTKTCLHVKRLAYTVLSQRHVQSLSKTVTALSFSTPVFQSDLGYCLCYIGPSSSQPDLGL